jgi:hypothetical protein
LIVDPERQHKITQIANTKDNDTENTKSTKIPRSMMADTSLVQDYRVALALNNIGVKLLERGAFRQSLDTLQDAVFMMKSHLRYTAGAQGRVAKTTPDSSTTVQSRLSKAMKRLANAQPVVRPAVKVNAISFEGTLPSSCIFPFEDQTMQFPLPIEIHTLNCDCIKELDQDLVSGIVLLNFGIAHLCASKVMKSSEKLREGALKLLNMAYSIISFRHAISQIEQIDVHQISESRFLLVIIILNHTAQVLTEMGRHSEAQESQEKLVRLGRLICTEADLDIFFNLSSIAPAA